MADQIGIYLTVLFIGTVLTVLVGQILIRSARPFLEDAFPRPETAGSLTRLLVVLFHLIVLGVLALVVSIDFTFATTLQTIVVKLGLVLLVLGIAHGATLLVLARLRARRRLQARFDEKAVQAEQFQQAQRYGEYPPGTPPAPSASSPADAEQARPAIDHRPGR